MNRNDRKIAIAAIGIALLAFVGVWLADTPEGLPKGASPSASLDSGSHRAHVQRPVQYDAIPSRPTPESFPFDPNTADSAQLRRLGLSSWQIRNIYKYRARGGIYRRKEDFAQLYGLTIKDYRRLEPYIRISSDYQPAATLVKKDTARRDSLHYPVKIEENEHVVLNTADTAELRRVPGIGVYYAKEIARYGQRLGGYVSVDQLDEIDDFPREAKKYFTIEQAAPVKLNLNRLTLQQLRRHPYINFYQAKTIVEYRRLHGDLKSLQDLRLSKDFPPEAISRLQPYVTF